MTNSTIAENLLRFCLTHTDGQKRMDHFGTQHTAMPNIVQIMTWASGQTAITVSFRADAISCIGANMEMAIAQWVELARYQMPDVKALTPADFAA